MKQVTKFSLAIISIAALLLVSCDDKKEQSPQQAQAMPFVVSTIPQRNITAYTEYPTTIEGIVNSDVRAKVSGYIQKVFVDEGELVHKNQPLFKLETQSLDQDAGAAKARVNVAQVEVDKLIPLVEKNIISAVQLETAKANLAQAKANYSSISANINYATIKSPIDGFVGAIPYREGSLVSATSTMPLTTVSDIKQVYAYFSMNESDYLDFLQNTEGKNLQDKVNHFPEVELILANGQTYSEKGKIQTVTGQVDAKTGTVSFRAVFDNPNQLITNGNSGTIKVPKNYQNAIVVPQASTLEQQGQTFVYKVKDDTVLETLINVIDRTSELYIVDSGVKEGDKIVVKGIGKLRNRMPIKPQPIAFDSVVKPIKSLFQ